MKERCITLLNNFKNTNYNEQNILDTSNLSINETVDIIENDSRFILQERIYGGKIRLFYYSR